MLPLLLFLSPCFPDAEGYGPARRAHAVVSALARRHRVSLLVITPDYNDRTPPAPLPEGCVGYRHIPSFAGRNLAWKLRRTLARRPRLFSALTHQPPDWFDHTRRRFQLAIAACPSERVNIIHAFRLPMAPYALALRHARHPGAELRLDTDDIESLTCSRMAVLHEANGEHDDATLEHAKAEGYATQEARLFPRFAKVYTCSAHDAGRLRATHPNVRVLPNTVAVPATLPPTPALDKTLRLLFIGSFGYSPNSDALRWLCSEILPALRERVSCELIVAGRAASESLVALLNRTEGVRFAGPVESAATAYANAHAVVAPLRAGGGTRLKILEAFAQGRPVISTTLGIEGIDATPGEHYLKADEPEAFVRACASLSENPGLRARLAENAFAFVRRHHSSAAVESALSLS